MFRTWCHVYNDIHELLVAHTWKPWQPAVPFPGAPSSPWNKEETETLTNRNTQPANMMNGTHVSPTLTLSPIWPLSPGAPFIPLGPLGPWEMKGMMRPETHALRQVCWKHLDVVKTFCVCFCEQEALKGSLFVSCKTHFWSRWAFIASVSWRPSLARRALENNEKTVNETLLKHFSSLIKFEEKNPKTMVLRHQPVWVNRAYNTQWGRFSSFRTDETTRDFGAG